MTQHGQDARATPRATARAMATLAMTQHGQDARATPRATARAMAILAMTQHGQDARATPRATARAMATLAMTQHGQDARAIPACSLWCQSSLAIKGSCFATSCAGFKRLSPVARGETALPTLLLQWLRRRGRPSPSGGGRPEIARLPESGSTKPTGGSQRFRTAQKPVRSTNPETAGSGDK